MSTPNEVKKNILKDWSAEFPILYTFAQDKLYKIIGPVIVGLELTKLPRSDDYRPHFVCYPLWKGNEKECLEESLILREIVNRRGLQFNIPYLKHENYFVEAAGCVRDQIQISFEKDVSLESMFELIDYQFGHILIKSSPVGQAKLYELKLLAALYVEDFESAIKILNEIEKAGRAWLPNLFEWKYGKFVTWFKTLEERVSNRGEFMRHVQINKQDKKLSKLHISELKI